MAVVPTCATLAQLKFAMSFTSKYYKPDLWVENRVRRAKLFLVLTFVVMKDGVKSLRHNVAQI